jgi:uncharacterized membrane protein HdeD (DUF308 family)
MAGAMTARGWTPQRGTDVLPTVTREDLRRARRLFLAVGILAIVTGAVAIVVPAVASVATAIFIGWVLVAAGVLIGVHAIAHHVGRTRGEQALRIVNALLTLFVGVFLLVAPLTGLLTLTFMLAAWFFVIGAIELYAAWRVRGVPGVWILALSGGLNLALGALIALNLPSSATWAIGLIVGVNLAFWGMRALVLASLLKEQARA